MFPYFIIGWSNLISLQRIQHLQSLEKSDSNRRALNLQCRHLIRALNARAVRAQCTTAGPIATQFPGHGCEHRSLTSQLNVALIRKLRGSLTNMPYYFDMLSMGVCTTRHWQTHGRPVPVLICSYGQMWRQGSSIG